MHHAMRSSTRARGRVQALARGASTVEYLVLLGMVALICLAGLRVLSARLAKTAARQGERVAAWEGSDTNVATIEALRFGASAGPAEANATVPGAFSSLQENVQRTLISALLCVTCVAGPD